MAIFHAQEQTRTYNILDFMTSLFSHKNFTDIKPKCKQTKNLLKIHVAYLQPWYTCWLPHPPLHSPLLYTLRLPPFVTIHITCTSRSSRDEGERGWERRGLEKGEGGLEGWENEGGSGRRGEREDEKEHKRWGVGGKERDGKRYSTNTVPESTRAPSPETQLLATATATLL